MLVPIIRCKWFFDSYAIKLWAVQIGAAIVFILFCYRPPQIRINSAVHTHTNNFGVWVKGLLLAYLVINVLSWLTVPYPYRFVALPALVAIITYILMCFLVSQYLTKPDIAVILWILVTVGVAILGIYHYYSGNPAISTLGNENFLASHIALTILVTLGYFWRYLKNPSTQNRFTKRNSTDKMYFGKKAFLLGTGIAVLLIFGTALAFTRSRGAWLGLSAGLVSFGIIAGIPPGKRLLTSVIVILVVLALVSMPAIVEFFPRQFEGDVRPAIWESSIYMIAEKPWLGWGKGAYFIFYPQFRIIDYWLTRSPTDLTIHAHNEFLQIWSETGIVGLVIFLALIAVILRIGIQKIDRRNDYAQRYLMTGMVSGVICLLTHNLVCNNLQINSSAIFLWLTLGLILGMDPPALSLWPSLQQTGFDKTEKRPQRSTCQLVFRQARPLILLVLTGIMAIIIWCVSVGPAVSQYIFKQGWNFRQKNNWTRAVEKYKKAIVWDPWNVEMHYRMAYAYVQSGKLDKAIEKYKDVCRLAPDYGNVHRNMGIVYIKTGEHRLAAQRLLKARQINPYDLVTLHNLTTLGESHGEGIRG